MGANLDDRLLEDLLRKASEALLYQEAETCLEYLLVAWRETRSERLVVLIERLSRRLTAGLPPLDCTPRSPGMTRLRPEELPLLLDSLLAGASQAGADTLAGRLKDFGRWRGDPRFTSALLELAHLPVAHEPPVTRALCHLIVAQRDPRIVEPLRALHASLPQGTPYSQQVDLAIRQLAPSTVPRLKPDTTALLDALEKDLSESESWSTAPRSELLARVYADPEDVSARLVLADFLLERGDPMGELITLQCMPGADEERLQQLLEAHRWRWEAPLGPAIVRGPTRFVRGFPEAVRMENQWTLPLPEPRPCWATVRELDLRGGPFPGMGEWLMHPNLRGVTSLQRVPLQPALELGAPGLGLEKLGMEGHLPIPRLSVLLTRLAGLPRLKQLLFMHAEPLHVSLCAASPLGSRLERFEVRALRWSLVVEPAREPQVQATLVDTDGAPQLATAIQGARGFGVRTLSLRMQHGASAKVRRILEQEAAAYARVEWH
ncbi:TIGR02996 domain-containing protein [Pyxidicoccus sp. 3LG]